MLSRRSIDDINGGVGLESDVSDDEEGMEENLMKNFQFSSSVKFSSGMIMEMNFRCIDDNKLQALFLPTTSEGLTVYKIWFDNWSLKNIEANLKKTVVFNFIFASHSII